MNKLQRGFTLVESLLIILTAAIIGFGGWWVWHGHHNRSVTTPDRHPAKKAMVRSGECSLDNGWNGSLVQTGNKQFEFCQPAGWELLFSNGDKDLFYASESMLAYNPTIPAKQTETGGNDNRWDLYITSGSDGAQSLANFSKQGTIKAQNGLVATKYYYLTANNDPTGAGIEYLPQGTKQYNYVINGRDSEQHIYVNYIIRPNQSGQLSAIESLVKSIR